jgi:DNA polymerase bacteriophage-type
MPIDQETGPTFDISEIGFLDFEAANKVEDIKSGTFRYAVTADAIIAAYAIADGPVQTVAVDDFPQTLSAKDMPDDFMRHHQRVMKGEAVWAAWNAGFDRAIWNYSMTWMPFMEPHHIIDVMAQSVASGLAADLKTAAKQTGSTHKVESGSDLIKLFCIKPPHKPLRGKLTGQEGTADEHMLAEALKTHAGMGTPSLFPELWKLFQGYAGGDIVAMRDVFLRTRQLPLREWREYWAAEAVNERGIYIDQKMVAHAADLASIDRQRSKEELSRITNGVVGSVDQVAKITGWLMDRLPASGRDVLVKREEEVDEETGEVTKPAKYSLTRKQVVRLIAMCQAAEDRPELKTVLRVLQIRLYGGSKTPAKFARMLSQHVDGVLRGQYVFNGAAQTGRYSSKGTQVHNLARDALDHEPDLIEALLSKCEYDMLAKLGNDDPVARKLALLIRPTLVPDSGKVFVWSDWSQIEARVLPWLAGEYEEGALERLQIFRDVDADPSVPDLYTRTAAQLSNIPIGDQADPPARQGGGTGAGLYGRRWRIAEHGGRLRHEHRRFRSQGSGADLAREQSVGRQLQPSPVGSRPRRARHARLLRRSRSHRLRLPEKISRRLPADAAAVRPPDHLPRDPLGAHRRARRRRQANR